LESKMAVNLLVRRSLGYHKIIYTYLSQIRDIQSLDCAYIPRPVAVPFLFLG
jgi:hypothetical protein